MAKKGKRVSRRENAQARPGVRTIMKQGETKRAGDADKVGRIGKIMANNANPVAGSAPVGKLRSIMGQ